MSNGVRRWWVWVQVGSVAVLLVAALAVVAEQPSGGGTRVLVTSGQEADAGPDAQPPATTEPPTTTTTVVTTTPQAARVAGATTTTASRPPAGQSPATTVSGAGGSQPSTASVTFVNEYPQAVSVNVDGVGVVLGPGETAGPLAVTPAPSGNDTVELRILATPTCGVGDAMGYFEAGRSYRFTVRAGPNRCMAVPGGFPSPDFAVTLG